MSENTLIIITLQLLFNRSGITVTILWNMTALHLYIICMKVKFRGPCNHYLLKEIRIFHRYQETDLEWAPEKDPGSTTFLALSPEWGLDPSLEVQFLSPHELSSLSTAEEFVHGWIYPWELMPFPKTWGQQRSQNESLEAPLSVWDCPRHFAPWQLCRK